jgi:hypothetical protein
MMVIGYAPYRKRYKNFALYYSIINAKTTKYRTITGTSSLLIIHICSKIITSTGAILYSSMS